MGIYGVSTPKPARRISAATKKRRERKVIERIRAEVAERDGFCRIWKDTNYQFGPCEGVSEWAHFDELRRFKTRGKPADERHTTAGSFMGCTRHHGMYDQHRLDILPLSDNGADGELAYRRRES